jgi:hypothetical protein
MVENANRLDFTGRFIEGHEESPVDRFTGGELCGFRGFVIFVPSWLRDEPSSGIWVGQGVLIVESPR